MLVAALVLGLLWWLIGYCESQFPQVPFVFTVIRVVFVVLVVILLIAILLNLAGYPVIRLHAPGVQR
jgi:hypothetical protein